MPLLQKIWSVTSKLDDRALLAHMIHERHPGKVIVSASLKARSVVVLKMVAEIDPNTPVMFCQPGHEFVDSKSYREEIVGRLGLTDISFTNGRETEVQPGDHDHLERMWVENEDSPGQSFVVLHLNKSLEGFDCWISAVNHVERPAEIKHRVDFDGRLVRVDPVIRWSDDDVRTFMRENNLPYHKRAKRTYPKFRPDDDSDAPWYAY
ncbi:MAG: phosphoadenosine phosphosulfate reductase family protein [Rhizobiaceae bacterium]